MTSRPTDALLPCPFCGGPAEMFERWKGLWMVKCDACSVIMDPDHRSQEDCLDKWNRRSEAAFLKAKVRGEA